MKLGESQALIFSLYEDMKKLEAFLRGLTSGGKELTWFPMAGESEDEGNGGFRYWVALAEKMSLPCEGHIEQTTLTQTLTEY